MHDPDNGQTIPISYHNKIYDVSVAEAKIMQRGGWFRYRTSNTDPFVLDTDGQQFLRPMKQE